MEASAEKVATAEISELVKRMGRIGSAASPSFSPDGQWVAFVTGLSGSPQIWKVPVEGGFPRQITAFDAQVQGARWSPTSDWIAFNLAPGGSLAGEVWIVRSDGTEAQRLLGGDGTSNRVSGWTDDGTHLLVSSNRRDPSAPDPYLLEVATGELTRFSEASGFTFLTDVSPDRQRAVLWRMENRSSNDLLLVDRSADTAVGSPEAAAEDDSSDTPDSAPDSASAREIVLTPHEGPGSFGGGQLTPDGRAVYLTTNQDRDLQAFARLALTETGEPDQLIILAERDDAELDTFVLSPDGSRILLLWNQAGRSQWELLQVTPDGQLDGKLLLPEPPAEILSGVQFSRDSHHLVFNASGAAAPSDIWTLDPSCGCLNQLTFSPHAGVDLDQLVRPELVRYPAHDGLELTAWLYRPPGVTGPAPYVLAFHGGPEGQERPYFRSTFQALLSQGIGVLGTNVRGSSGFGKRFVNLDNGKLRFDAIRDIESSTRYLTQAGIADADRLGIMGGSYGGYMTMAGLTWYPDLFAAGANLYGVVNFETFFEHTEPYIAAISKIEYGDPDTQADLLRDLSPIHKVDQITAPTLVLHGANDTNVPVVEAEQVVDNLQRRNIPVRYVLFPDEGHGFRDTENRVTSTVEVVRWFGEWLGAGGSHRSKHRRPPGAEVGGGRTVLPVSGGAGG
ncbi:MAG: S9 family peptidase [Acidobacteriota bacterium]|nr:S9 family peptidase [Acidobacteriota bacterium]